MKSHVKVLNVGVLLRALLCVAGVPAVVCDTDSHANNKTNQHRPLLQRHLRSGITT